MPSQTIRNRRLLAAALLAGAIVLVLVLVVRSCGGDSTPLRLPARRASSRPTRCCTCTSPPIPTATPSSRRSGSPTDFPATRASATTPCGGCPPWRPGSPTSATSGRGWGRRRRSPCSTRPARPRAPWSSWPSPTAGRPRASSSVWRGPRVARATAARTSPPTATPPPRSRAATSSSASCPGCAWPSTPRPGAGPHWASRRSSRRPPRTCPTAGSPTCTPRPMACLACSPPREARSGRPAP